MTEKQIYETAHEICEIRSANRGISHDIDDCRKCSMHEDCFYQSVASDLYKVGYRKQIEGEWAKTCVKDIYQCTACKRPTKMDELCDSEALREYCPNCGAKMKGGERE